VLSTQRKCKKIQVEAGLMKKIILSFVSGNGIDILIDPGIDRLIDDFIGTFIRTILSLPFCPTCTMYCKLVDYTLARGADDLRSACE